MRKRRRGDNEGSDRVQTICKHSTIMDSGPNHQYRRDFFPLLASPIPPYNNGPCNPAFGRPQMRFDHPPRHMSLHPNPCIPRLRHDMQRPPGLRGPWPLKRPYSSIASSSVPPAIPGEESVQAAEKPEELISIQVKPVVAEPPKPLQSPSVQETSSDEPKERLPRELIMKFQALKCELCSVESTSTIQAKMHYTGKMHEKRVAQFMQAWSKETGEPLPKRYQLGAPKKKCGEALHCDVCNIELTSRQHADQHYMGRNHKRAMGGYSPLLAGYFNKPLGKWQRCPPEDPSGRFHIGTEFVSHLSTDPLGLLEKPVLQSANIHVFTCDLCHINTTSQDQLDMHYRGAKHRKALVATGKLVVSVDDSVPAKATKEDSILASVVHTDDGSNWKNQNVKEADAPAKDYSIFRTPSGQYYCQPCNLTLNSEAHFGQHCDSKRHKVQNSIFKFSEVKKNHAGRMIKEK